MLLMSLPEPYDFRFLTSRVRLQSLRVSVLRKHIAENVIVVPRELTSRRVFVVPAAMSKESKKKMFFSVETLALLQVPWLEGREKNRAQGFFLFFSPVLFALGFLLLFERKGGLSTSH